MAHKCGRASLDTHMCTHTQRHTVSLKMKATELCGGEKSEMATTKESTSRIKATLNSASRIKATRNP